MQRTKIDGRQTACSPQINPHPTRGKLIHYNCISTQVRCDFLVGTGADCEYQVLEIYEFMECTNEEARKVALKRAISVLLVEQNEEMPEIGGNHEDQD